MFIHSIHISLHDISLTQNILYQIKRDVAVWKRLGCPQRNHRTWWQIVATPFTGLAQFITFTHRWLLQDCSAGTLEIGFYNLVLGHRHAYLGNYPWHNFNEGLDESQRNLEHGWATISRIKTMRCNHFSIQVPISAELSYLGRVWNT